MCFVAHWTNKLGLYYNLPYAGGAEGVAAGDAARPAVLLVVGVEAYVAVLSEVRVSELFFFYHKIFKLCRQLYIFNTSFTW